jgi:hypothetical protein
VSFSAFFFTDSLLDRMAPIAITGQFACPQASAFYPHQWHAVARQLRKETGNA